MLCWHLGASGLQLGRKQAWKGRRVENHFQRGLWFLLAVVRRPAFASQLRPCELCVFLHILSFSEPLHLAQLCAPEDCGEFHSQV